MSNFFDNQIRKTMESTVLVKPRPVSRFEGLANSFLWSTPYPPIDDISPIIQPMEQNALTLMHEPNPSILPLEPTPSSPSSDDFAYAHSSRISKVPDQLKTKVNTQPIHSPKQQIPSRENPLLWHKDYPVIETDASIHVGKPKHRSEIEIQDSQQNNSTFPDILRSLDEYPPELDLSAFTPIPMFGNGNSISPKTSDYPKADITTDRVQSGGKADVQQINIHSSEISPKYSHPQRTQYLPYIRKMIDRQIFNSPKKSCSTEIQPDQSVNSIQNEEKTSIQPLSLRIDSSVTDKRQKENLDTSTNDTVQVTIGRVEVRAIPQPVSIPPKKKSQTPVVSLEEYLRQRTQGGNR